MYSFMAPDKASCKRTTERPNSFSISLTIGISLKPPAKFSGKAVILSSPTGKGPGAAIPIPSTVKESALDYARVSTSRHFRITFSPSSPFSISEE